jgi:hypothetical protein
LLDTFETSPNPESVRLYIGKKGLEKNMELRLLQLHRLSLQMVKLWAAVPTPAPVILGEI